MSWSRAGAALATTLVIAFALATPAAAADTSIRFRLGLFTPDGDSSYWDDKQIDFTGEPDDFEDLVGGVDFLVPLHPHMSLMFSADAFEGSDDQEYIAFEDRFGNAIEHTTTLDVYPLTAGLVVHLAPPGAPVVPYLGAGGGVYLWRIEEDGDFIDFGVEPAEVFSARFEDEGEAFGYYFVAGLEVPLGNYWSFLAEARWDRADDELSGDFEGLGDLDLSGRRISGGVAWRF